MDNAKDKKPTQKKLKQICFSDSKSKSGRELSYYIDDRIKLMKEVIQILKPKKIKNMAPQCMKNLTNEEINAMLLEELLGISNKRLKQILDGKSEDYESSSTDDEQVKATDVISLDDVTDDEFGIEVDLDRDKDIQKSKIRTGLANATKTKQFNDNGTDETSGDHLMSVLELLELQARARAIRSQLALENRNKTQEREQDREKTSHISDVEDTVVIDDPVNEEIIISSSESEGELTKDNRSNSFIQSMPLLEDKNHPSHISRNISNEDSVNQNEKSDSYLKEAEGHYKNSENADIKKPINFKRDMEIICETKGAPKKKRLELIPDNVNNMNKVLNKLHKMKKQKKKLGEKTKNKDRNSVPENCGESHITTTVDISFFDEVHQLDDNGTNQLSPK